MNMDRNYKYIRDTYNVPATSGRRIRFKDRDGIIVADRGNYIGVTFDDEKPGTISNLHPTWEVVYLGMGKIRPMTQSQKNYRDYLDADCVETFAEWMGFDPEMKKLKERFS